MRTALRTENKHAAAAGAGDVKTDQTRHLRRCVLLVYLARQDGAMLGPWGGQQQHQRAAVPPPCVPSDAERKRPT